MCHIDGGFWKKKTNQFDLLTNLRWFYIVDKRKKQFGFFNDLFCFVCMWKRSARNLLMPRRCPADAWLVPLWEKTSAEHLPGNHRASGGNLQMPLQGSQTDFPEKITRCPKNYNFKLKAPGQSQMPSRGEKFSRYASGCPPSASSAQQIFGNLFICRAQSEQMWLGHKRLLLCKVCLVHWKERKCVT